MINIKTMKTNIKISLNYIFEKEKKIIQVLKNMLDKRDKWLFKN